MVGGNRGEGVRALGLGKGGFPKSNPFKTYKNGKNLNIGYNPNQ